MGLVSSLFLSPLFFTSYLDNKINITTSLNTVLHMKFIDNRYEKKKDPNNNKKNTCKRKKGSLCLTIHDDKASKKKCPNTGYTFCWHRSVFGGLWLQPYTHNFKYFFLANKSRVLHKYLKYLFSLFTQINNPFLTRNFSTYRQFEHRPPARHTGATFPL